MQVCGKCEREIHSGQNVIVRVKAVFHRDPQFPPPIHALEIFEEEYMEHLTCEI